MNSEITEGMTECTQNSFGKEKLLDNFEVGQIYKYIRIKEEFKIKGCPSHLIVQYRVFPNSQFDYYETFNESLFNKFFKIVPSI